MSEEQALLAYVVTPGKGAGDRLLAAVANRLAAEGLALAGVVQENLGSTADSACHMDLRLLGGPDRLRISQDLGPLSRGCRLDVAGLEEAVARVAAGLDLRRPDLLVVNKFGKHESDGRGFRLLIGRALCEEIPVLTAVSTRNLPALLAFAEGMAVALPAQEDSLLRWARAVARPPGRQPVCAGGSGDRTGL